MGTGAAVRIRCLKRLSDGLFAVQNADYIRAPLTASSVHVSDQGFVELPAPQAAVGPPAARPPSSGKRRSSRTMISMAGSEANTVMA